MKYIKTYNELTETRVLQKQYKPKKQKTKNTKPYTPTKGGNKVKPYTPTKGANKVKAYTPAKGPQKVKPYRPLKPKT